jgi:hypothetical protein
MNRRIGIVRTLGNIVGVVAGVTVGASGCGAPAEQQAPSASVEIMGRIDAQSKTRAETGIEAWTVVREGRGFLLDGKTHEGVTVRQLRVQPVSKTIVRNGHSQVIGGQEATTPEGGLARVFFRGREVESVEFKPDDATFTAFARDAQALPKGDVTLSCSWFQKLACIGALLSAEGGCTAAVAASATATDGVAAGVATAGWVACVGGILQAVGCGDCFENIDSSGLPPPPIGGPPQPCPGQIDCGDGTHACPPKVCP